MMCWGREGVSIKGGSMICWGRGGVSIKGGSMMCWGVLVSRVVL